MLELIPLGVLFGNPERESPRISPGGTKLAWIAPSGEALNVRLAQISAEAGVDWAAARVITDDTDRGIRQFEWAHDGHHLLYLQDIGGDENWRLHDVDVHTMARRDLTPFDGVPTQIIGLERNRPDEVLLGLNKANPELHDVYRLDLPSGELTKEIDNPGFIAWVSDTELIVRGAVAPQLDTSFTLLVRDDTDSEWRELLAIPAEDAESLNVVGFSPDGHSLLITSSVGAQTSRLVGVDAETEATEVLAEDWQDTLYERLVVLFIGWQPD
jgi:hypothetical protein